jgi:hypothetical protein
MPIEGEAALPHQTIVVPVRPNPEPEDVVASSNAEGPTPETDSDRHDRFRRMNLLEAKARVTGILEKDAIRPTTLLLDWRRKLGETTPEPRRYV